MKSSVPEDRRRLPFTPHLKCTRFRRGRGDASAVIRALMLGIVPKDRVFCGWRGQKIANFRKNVDSAIGGRNPAMPIEFFHCFQWKHVALVAERIIRGERDINTATFWPVRNSISITNRNFGSILILWQQYGYYSQVLTGALLLPTPKCHPITPRRNRRLTKSINR